MNEDIKQQHQIYKASRIYRKGISSYSLPSVVCFVLIFLQVPILLMILTMMIGALIRGDKVYAGWGTIITVILVMMAVLALTIGLLALIRKKIDGPVIRKKMLMLFSLPAEAYLMADEQMKHMKKVCSYFYLFDDLIYAPKNGTFLTTAKGIMVLPYKDIVKMVSTEIIADFHGLQKKTGYSLCITGSDGIDHTYTFAANQMKSYEQQYPQMLAEIEERKRRQVLGSSIMQ